MKTIAKTLLLILAFTGIAYYAWGKIAGDGGASDTSIAAAEAAAPVVVTYFSSDVRCPTCVDIETLTRRTVEERFAGPLAEGQLAFQILNMDEKENAHFIDDYALAFKTVVIEGDAHTGDKAGTEAGTDENTVEPWVKMDGVWSRTAKPDEFLDYLAKEIDRRLPKAG